MEEDKQKGIRVHRKGKVYIEYGNTLTWNAKEAFRISDELRGKLQWTKHNDPVEFRELAAMVTVEMVKYMVARDGQPVDLSRVYQQASYTLGISPETVKRYIFTHTAEGAELMMAGKQVTVNPFFGEDDE